MLQVTHKTEHKRVWMLKSDNKIHKIKKSTVQEKIPNNVKIWYIQYFVLSSS